MKQKLRDLGLEEWVWVLDQLLSRWRVVAVQLAVVVVFALGVALIWPRIYEARVVVVFSQRIDQLSMDNRFSVMPTDIDDRILLSIYHSLTAIAMSDPVLQTVLDTHRAALPASMNIELLREELTARLDDFNSVVTLTTKMNNPQLAAAIVNTWADAFEGAANRIYGEAGGSLDQVEAELARIAVRRTAAEEALVAFLMQDERVQLRSELQALQERYAMIEVELLTIEQLRLDLNSFREQLAVRPTDAAIGFSDALTASSMQTQVQNFVLAKDRSVELQLVDTRLVAADTVRELLDFLAELETSLQVREEALIEQREVVAVREMLLQSEIEARNAEAYVLQQEMGIARESYEALTRRVFETRIETSLFNQPVQVVGEASIPQEHAGLPRSWLAIFLATIGGIAVLGWTITQIAFDALVQFRKTDHA